MKPPPESLIFTPDGKCYFRHQEAVDHCIKYKLNPEEITDWMKAKERPFKLTFDTKVVRVIVTGSPRLTDYELLKFRLNNILKNIDKPIEIVSGGTEGADELGERFAKERAFGLRRFKPNWKWHGNNAGVKRRVEMMEHATHCVIFDSGDLESKNSKELAEKYNLVTRIIQL